MIQPTRASFIGLVAMAIDGLFRKKTRTILTMLGVIIGVLAMTLIIALGNGMEEVLNATVDDEDNLRQVSVQPGTGYRNKARDARDEVEDEFSTLEPVERRQRMRRAARARDRRAGNQVAARQGFNENDLTDLRTTPHVQVARPLVVERYQIHVKEDANEPMQRLAYGIDTHRKRHANQMLAGEYLSSPGANEVLIHEYLAWQWGYKSVDDMGGLVGKTLVLEPLGSDMPAIPGNIREMATRLAGVAAKLTDEDIDRLGERLDEQERAQLRLLLRLAPMVNGTPNTDGGEARQPLAPSDLSFPVELRIAGIIRELQRGDSFNILEDGNAYQVDIFMPQQLADELYRVNEANRERGYMNVLMLSDDARYAQDIEEAMREKGYTAVSVGSALERINTTLGAISIALSFLTAVALVVAALGIVNTMLTSVLERTREIGLWKALGARDGQVRTIFLLEAAFLGLLGGSIGLLLAWILMIPGNAYALDELSEQVVVPLNSKVFSLPLWVVFVGPGMATFISMLASLMPAWRASRIDPVKALRDE